MKAEFRILKNGYDRFQVDQKIHQYQEELNGLQQQIQLYEKQVETYELRQKEAQNKISSLQNELEIRQKMYRDLNDSAIVQANKIVENAHQQAQGILSQALSSTHLLLSQMESYSDIESITNAELETNKQQLLVSIQALKTLLYNLSND